MFIFAHKDNMILGIYKKIVLTLYLFLAIATMKVIAQDIHFSQFFMSPQSLNPSLSGSHKGELRLTDIYRAQWFTLKFPFRSHYFSLDHPFFIRENKFSYGFSLVYDNSGDEVFNLSKYYLTLSWHPALGKGQLNLGIQAGYAERNYNFNKLTFPDQYDKISGYYDPYIPTADAGISQKINFYDVNAGISWASFTGNIKPEIGLAVFHINQPQESFTSSLNYLPVRKTAFFKFSFPISDYWQLSPAWMFSEMNKASEMLTGIILGYKIMQGKFNLKNINSGIFIRNGFKRNTDAVIIMGSLSYKRFDIGLSYDLNISTLGKYTGYQGAIELALIYTAISKVFDKHKIPCERL